MSLKTERLVSIDFLRGFTVAGMILVNSPGSWETIYPPFSHSEWNGCTPTDLVFPFFLFIVGVSIHFSLSKAKIAQVETKSLIFKILKRSLILFGLGLFLNAFPFFQLTDLRIMGVLQRISIVFGVCAVLYLLNNKWNLLTIATVLLIFYWVLMVFIPFSDVFPNPLSPGNDFSSHIDRIFLSGHMWSHSKIWDPEGLFSTLPAISSGLIGVLTGMWIDGKEEIKRKLLVLVITGCTLIVLGLIIDKSFPINKSLWSSSFVLFTSGIAILTASFFYWLIDGLKIKGFIGPFLAFGSNAISAYLLSEILAKIGYTFGIILNGNFISYQELVFKTLFLSWLNPYNASLAMAIFTVFICFIPIWVLYQRKVFIKV